MSVLYYCGNRLSIEMLQLSLTILLFGIFRRRNAPVFFEKAAKIGCAFKAEFFGDLRDGECAVTEHKGRPPHQKRIPIFQGGHLVFGVEQII